MSRPYRVGLVVGKFAPLHRGHELLLSRAFELCERVVVVSYCKPEIPGYGPDVRRAWLRSRFPGAELLVLGDGDCVAMTMPENDDPPTRHRRFVGHLCRDVVGVAVEAVFTSEAYGDPFAEELTAYYRERDPAYPRVAHVSVDPARAEVPISGSRIRADVHAAREWLSPVVYASFVERVCLLGGESSGKSTLAAALARHFGTAFVPEYARELWNERGGRLAFEDMTHIVRRQLELEAQAALVARRYLFCDTSPLTTAFYSLDLFGRVEPEVEREAQRRYALAILCAPDIPFEQDGTRRDAAFRQRQHEFYLRRLAELGQPYVVVEGSVERRIRMVEDALR